MNHVKHARYVPVPQPVTTDITVACHYYPGWKPGASDLHNGFADLRDFPERTPLLGYYDESNPEVTDWEIKWACEHGIGCFIYCWYRYQNNVGHPVTREALRFGHAIHEGLLRARYRSFIKFAIMWECQDYRWGTLKDENDLIDNLLPFWVENYFSQSNYLVIDGKPLLYIYAQDNVVKALGSPEACRSALARANEAIKAYGFKGLTVCCMENRVGMSDYTRFAPRLPADYYRSCGFDCGFQYTLPMMREMLTDEQYTNYLKTLRVPAELVIARQTSALKQLIADAPDFYMFTNSVMRNSEPWHKIFNINPAGPVLQWELTPTQWRTLLTESKKLIETLPENSIGRKVFILDTWNEWSEGHFIAPHAGHGFAYLQAVREVFSRRDNIPDYRTPDLLGLGPYDTAWQEIIGR